MYTVWFQINDVASLRPSSLGGGGGGACQLVRIAGDLDLHTLDAYRCGKSICSIKNSKYIARVGLDMFRVSFSEYFHLVVLSCGNGYEQYCSIIRKTDSFTNITQFHMFSYGTFKS